MYSKYSIFATLGFTLVKLRFAGHEACSREPQESSKRVVRELLGSIWEPLGAPWGSLGAVRALPWAALGSSSASLSSQNGPEHIQSWSSSEISEIVTTPTQELHFRASWRSLEALWEALWGFLGSLLCVFRALLGLSCLLFVFYWPHIYFLGALLGYLCGSRAILGSLGGLLDLS